MINTKQKAKEKRSPTWRELDLGACPFFTENREMN